MWSGSKPRQLVAPARHPPSAIRDLMAANLVNSFSIIDDLVQLIINAIKHISGQRRQLARLHQRLWPGLGVVRLQLSKRFGPVRAHLLAAYLVAAGAN